MDSTILNTMLPTLILSTILILVYIVAIFRKNKLHNFNFWVTVINKSILLYGISVVFGIIVCGVFTLYGSSVNIMLKQLYTPIGIGAYTLRIAIMVFLLLLVFARGIHLEYLCNKEFYVKDYKYTRNILSTVVRVFILLLQAGVSVFLAYLLYKFSWIDFSNFESLGFILIQVVADIIIVLGFLNVPMNMAKCKALRRTILKQFIFTLVCYVFVHFVLNIAQGEYYYDILFHDTGVQVNPSIALTNWLIILIPALAIYMGSIFIKPYDSRK